MALRARKVSGTFEKRSPDQRSQRDCSEEKNYYNAYRCVAANCRNVMDLSKCILVHNIPFFGD